MKGAALEVSNVTKIYSISRNRSVKALDDVSLAIEKGEIFGLLGPNGAGKTTLINCAIGIIPMTSGRICVFGRDVVSEYTAARAKIGFVYQEVALDNFFSAKWSLQFHRGFHGRRFEPSHVENVLRDLDLWQHRDKKPDQLSGGMRRRLALAQAIVHTPPFLILDEPTAGVDIELREKTWSIIRRLNAKGTTVLLTTHYIDEAEAICHRIGIINKGRFLKVAPTRSLVDEMGHRSMVIHVKKQLDYSTFKSLPYSCRVYETLTPGLWSYQVFIGPGAKEVCAVLAWFEARGVALEEVEIRPASLEDVFRKMAWGEDKSL